MSETVGIWDWQLPEWFFGWHVGLPTFVLVSARDHLIQFKVLHWIYYTPAKLVHIYTSGSADRWHLNTYSGILHWFRITGGGWSGPWLTLQQSWTGFHRLCTLMTNWHTFIFIFNLQKGRFISFPSHTLYLRHHKRHMSIHYDVSHHFEFKIFHMIQAMGRTVLQKPGNGCIERDTDWQDSKTEHSNSCHKQTILTNDLYLIYTHSFSLLKAKFEAQNRTGMWWK